jgi:hypothetical protein
MGAVKHSNFFSTTLATPPTGTTEAAFTVTSASNLPTLGAGDWCYVVIKNSSLVREVIKIGTIAGTTLTPASGGRGADGSTAYASWVAGDVIELCAVNASLLDLLYEFKNNFYNAAKTFKSVFTNTNTAARTYTFADRDGNVITDADIVAAAAVTPVDANVMPVMVGGVLKNVTWANVKATLKTYFDALYAAIGAITGSGLTQATGRILGRTTASTGAIEELTVGAGLSLSAGALTANVASQADMEAATSATVVVTPSVVKHNPGVAKAWGMFTGAGTLQAGHNITSVVRSSLGIYAVTLGDDMSSGNYTIVASMHDSGFVIYASRAAGSFQILCRNVADSAYFDPVDVNFVCFGDQ